MTRLDNWFSSIFLGAVPPLVLSLAFSLVMPLFLPAVPSYIFIAAGIVVGLLLDFTLLRHVTVLAYVCPRAVLIVVTLLYAVWFSYILRGCPLLHVLIGPAVAWIIGRRRRRSDQSREHLRASINLFMPWLLGLLAAACIVGIYLAGRSEAFTNAVNALWGNMPPWLLTLLLSILSAGLVVLEYFLIRFTARKSYDHLFIAPISSL